MERVFAATKDHVLQGLKKGLGMVWAIELRQIIMVRTRIPHH